MWLFLLCIYVFLFSSSCSTQCELELAEGLRPVVVEAPSGGHPTVEVTPASEEPSQEAEG